MILPQILLLKYFIHRIYFLCLTTLSEYDRILNIIDIVVKTVLHTAKSICTQPFNYLYSPGKGKHKIRTHFSEVKIVPNFLKSVFVTINYTNGRFYLNNVFE